LKLDTSLISGSDYKYRMVELQLGQGTNLPVELSIDGQHFTNARKLFEFIEPLVMLKLRPETGIHYGGTRLTIDTMQVNKTWFKYESYNVRCIFDDTDVSARFVDNSTIECFSPPSLKPMGGEVFIKLSINNQDFSVNSLPFVYQPSNTFLSIYPTFGRIEGDTIVNITGPSIVKSDDAVCRFGDQVVEANYCVDGLIVCQTPAVPYPQKADVSFSLNKQDFQKDTYLVYEYVEQHFVTKIDPVRGTVTGHTKVSIAGQKFPQPNKDAVCRFGDQLVPLIRNTDHSASCETPAIRRDFEIQQLDVGLVPYKYPIQEIEAKAFATKGDVFTIASDNDKWMPTQKILNLTVSDRDEVQELSFGINVDPNDVPRVATVTFADFGQIQEIQSVRTFAKYRPEIQSLYIRAPYGSYPNSIQEIQALYFYDSRPTGSGGFSSNFMVNYGAISVTFSAASSSTFVENLFRTNLPLLCNLPNERFGLGRTSCNVTVSESGSGSFYTRKFTINFPFGSDNVLTPTISCLQGCQNNPLVQTISDGGVSEIQRVEIMWHSENLQQSYVQLGIDDQKSFRLYPNATDKQVKSALSDTFNIGFTDVKVTYVGGLSTWEITFTQRLGNLDLINVTLVDIDETIVSTSVTRVRKGTSGSIQGTFTLSMAGLPVGPLPFDITAEDLQSELNNVSPHGDIAVTKYPLINGGSMFLMQFKDDAGDVPQITVDGTLLSGSLINVECNTFQQGSSVKGQFILNTVDRYGNPVQTAGLRYNASNFEVKAALEAIDPRLTPLVVTRIDNGVKDTFIWKIEFPFSVGTYPLLEMNAAGLTGFDLYADITRSQQGRRASVQKVSTMGSSKLSGYFRLTLDGESSEPIPYDASALQMYKILSKIPRIGDIGVTREVTGIYDLSSWDSEESQMDKSDYFDEADHLKVVKPLFEFDLRTYDWRITFISKSGVIPLFVPCCDESAVNDVATVATLVSEWSKDSKVTVVTELQGDFERMVGQVTLSVGQATTLSLDINNDDGNTIAAALDYVGIRGCTVTRGEYDVNYHRTWSITFPSSIVPYMDTLYVPSLYIETKNVFPIYSRSNVIFDWLQKPVQHEIQDVLAKNSSTNVACKMPNLLGQTGSNPTITFKVTDTQQSIYNKFNPSPSLFWGRVEVIKDAASPNKVRFMYATSTSNFSLLKCGTNANVYSVQNSSLIPLSGSFKLRLIDKNGTFYETPTISLPTTLQTLETEINSNVPKFSQQIMFTQPTASTSMKQSYLFTFVGDYVGGDVNMIEVITTSLSGTNAYALMNENVKGNEIGGLVTIYSQWDTMSTSARNEPRSAVHAIQKVLGRDAINVTVDIEGPTKTGSYQWRIAYFNSGVSPVYEMFVKSDKVTGDNKIVTLYEPQNGTFPLNGKWQLHYGVKFETMLYNATANDVVEALIRLEPNKFLGVWVNMTMYNVAGVRRWVLTLADGQIVNQDNAATALAVSSSLNGTNADITITKTATSARLLDGNIKFKFNGAASGNFRLSSVTTSQITTAVTSLIFSTYPNVVISVRKVVSQPNHHKWQITYNSLTCATITPFVEILPSTLEGYYSNVTSRIANTFASLPLTMFDIQNSGTYQLFWNNVLVGMITSLTTANDLKTIILAKTDLFKYAQVELRLGLGPVAARNYFYILVVPVTKTFDEMFQPSNYKFTLKRTTQNRDKNGNITVYDNPLNFMDSGPVVYSLNEEACYDDINGIFCSPKFDFEVSDRASALSSNVELEKALSSLRSIKEVKVTSQTLSGAYGSNDYFIYGRRYDITFIKATKYSRMNSVTDLGSSTWSPFRATNVVPLLYVNNLENRVGFDDKETEELFDIPAVQVNMDKLNSGWITYVSEKLKGKVYDYVKINSQKVAVDVSFNGQDFSSQSVTFEYIAIANVTKSIPTHGPFRGGTEVIVFGSGFVRSSSLSCQFGEDLNSVVRVVHFLNSSAVLCITPPSLVAKNVFIKVSNNGYFINDDISTSYAVYNYDADIKIDKLIPSLGSTAGNFSIRVVGGPFLKSHELRCKFGKIAVQAFFVSGTEIQCWVPPHPPGIFPVEISLNDQDFSSARKPFFYHKPLSLSRIFPVGGPAFSGGTDVNVYGANFVNSSLLTCRFFDKRIPGIFVSSNYIICPSPALTNDEIASMRYVALSEQFHRLDDPQNVALGIQGRKNRLFPGAYFYPLYLSKLATLEVSNNDQDYTDSGISFLYQADAMVSEILPNSGQVNTKTSIIVKGNNFVNSSYLRCRIGEYISIPIFLARDMVLCFTPRMPLIQPDHGYIRTHRTLNQFTPHERASDTSPSYTGPNVVYVEISNNGQDYTNDRQTFTFDIVCPSGFYCPEQSVLPCPPGTFCPGQFNMNFTLCPMGTYNPLFSQATCRRCPMGFLCPDEGMQVPRVCPPGAVCEFTGMVVADNPCPEGHFCLEGTATSATTCGHPDMSSDLFPIMSHAERPSTYRKNRIAQGQQLTLGARNSGCWTNATDDYGLQVSLDPAQFWMERHMLPLATDSPFVPQRGRFCLDDKCLQLQDYNNLDVSDYAFDYTGFSFRRPIPCPAGMYCHPGTAVDQFNSRNFTTPQPCYESMYCPEGSNDPVGYGECPPGYYCPFGAKIACPVGTYCPRDGHWDPMPCPPGTFNAQVGIQKCTKCPRGFICPGFGRVAPAICPPGFVCSKDGLRTPNSRCPAGYFCPNGTVTVDPFRNDTSLRPYACRPGTYCLTGVGFATVKKGDFMFAQDCTEGFYCEAGSNSPRGNGLCPSGFFCPLGTATPQPAKVGTYAELLGTIKAANCLPGFYAPTIETKICYPCPPGTACEGEGMYIATLCPPGTFRSTLNEAGIPCIACPQGTFSKNYGLRERGECVRCAPGVVCPVEGMTLPCAHSDLPMPYEPVVKYQGAPVLEYTFPDYARPGYFLQFECLRLNDGYMQGRMEPLTQIYFFGELVPPYIDALGRGPNFRACDQFNLKYQLTAKCYINTQRFGSPRYLRLSEYLGPQFDIQFGYNHQGYGKLFPNGTKYYDGFFGAGSLYIDLPHARKFEPSFNCTRGTRLMNITRVLYDEVGQTVSVYTDPIFDPIGYSRSIPRGEDMLYPGTCEADLVCYSSVNLKSNTEAQSCAEGFVCDERTSSDLASNFLCRSGYVCDFGTTPDPDLRSFMGQYKRLCPAGYVCEDGTGLGQQYRNLCPNNFYCPTGTGNNLLGTMAGDSFNRNLPVHLANPYYEMIHVRYAENDDIRVISSHDKRCFESVDIDLSLRYTYSWIPEGQQLTNPSLLYLKKARRSNADGSKLQGNVPPYSNDPILTGDANRSHFYRPISIQSSLQKSIDCGRDHKWRLIEQVEYRKECNCTIFLHVLTAVYRLWRCTAGGEKFDPLGIASINPPFKGINDARDYWFPRTHFQKSQQQCKFHHDGIHFNLTSGKVPHNPLFPSIGSTNTGLLDISHGIELQFTWLEKFVFQTYKDLKEDVVKEYTDQLADLTAIPTPLRHNIDPYIFDLKKSIEKIEEYGTLLEEYVWFDDGFDYYDRPIKVPGRKDICECQNLNRCPNGTVSINGATKWQDCVSESVEILRRVNVVPSWYNESTPVIGKYLKNVSDYWELSGSDSTLPEKEQTYKLGTLVVEANDVVVVTMDFTHIAYNLTYGEHYQISVYIDCKPCPSRYFCDYTSDPATCTTNPTLAKQKENYQFCLDRYKKKSCMNKHGITVDCKNKTRYDFATFMEPDMHKCDEIGYFCDTRYLPKLKWKTLVDEYTGIALAGHLQEKSKYEVDLEWKEEMEQIVDPAFRDTFYKRTPGCCECERHWMPYYFQKKKEDLGYPDNKHGFVQLQLHILERSELTIVFELLHGQYYQDFDKNIPDRGDIFIHRPARSYYSPSTPNRSMFMAIIEASDFEGQLEMPLNLPLVIKRTPKSRLNTLGAPGTLEFGFEKKILFGRTSNLFQADPFYEKRYEDHKRDLYIGAIVKNMTKKDPSFKLPPFSEFAAVPDLRSETAGLYMTADTITSVRRQMIWWSTGVDNPEGFLGLPYFPYFSNCKGSDNTISISKMMETDPMCDIVQYQNTVPVSPYPWAGAMYPNSDMCNTSTTPDLFFRQVRNITVPWLGPYNGALFECYFEEQIDIPLAYPRWYEAAASTVLFYLGAEPFPAEAYEPQFIYDKKTGNKTYTSMWGRGAPINAIRGTYQALPVLVDGFQYGYSMVVPRQVQLLIEFYQVNQGYKRIVRARVIYPKPYLCFTLTNGGAEMTALVALGIPQCITDVNGAIATSEYQLEVLVIPLWWYDLLNAFQFDIMIYLIFFVLAGFIAIVSGAFIWGLNRLLTRLRYPPPFHGITFLYTIGQPAITGVGIASLPIMITVLAINIWFMDPADGGVICSPDPINAPSPMCLEDVLDWAETATIDPSVFRAGRKMVCLMAVGLYITFVSGELMLPNWSDEDIKPDLMRNAEKNSNQTKTVAEVPDDDELPPSETFQPHIWRRANFFLMNSFMQMGLMIQMEFSYSAIFGNNVYQFIIIWKVIYFAVEVMIVEPYLGDKLCIAPMIASNVVVGNMTTMGASNFSQFLLSYFAGLYMTILERLYVAPFIGDIMSLWPRWSMMLQRRIRGNKRMTREEKAEEELEWRRINEEIELESEGIGPMLDSFCDYAVDTTGLILGPITYACLQIFYDEFQVASRYNILTNQIILYIVFAAMIIPFTLVTDIFLHNTQELIHGWKIYDYVSYQRYRFSVREYRWILRNPVVDESVSEDMQSVDLLCFSSQYYFLISFLAFGMVIICLSITGLLRISVDGYNPMGDPTAMLILAFFYCGGEAMRLICRRLADVKIRRINWRGLWATKQMEGTVDDDIAAKLAIGEGRQADLEQERLELQALNSERFRHRFLERNRPWILQHLIELLTPRSLDAPGPDGRPTIEYVRDVYADLMAMGEGLRKPGDRDDISSGEEGDELEGSRRNWSKQPLTGASLAIARLWLGKARKRRAFSKFIRGIIDQNKKATCEICGRNPEENGIKLTCLLATKGFPDVSAIDRLILGFENQYSPDEVDPNLWKAYFRAHAEYCTRCSVCEDAMAQERLLQHSRAPGPSLNTRPQDISSSDDDDDDGIKFDPVVVTRTSAEGRMMSKWLLSARKKLGGMFPRPEAKKQMDKYAQKLRQLKLKKTREQLNDSMTLKKEDIKEELIFNAATSALAIKWVRAAREALETKFRVRSETLREDLDATLVQMPEEEDWYYGAQTRLEGRSLQKKGAELDDDRKTLEAESSVKIHKIEADLGDYIRDRETEMERERKTFELKLAQQNDRINLDIDVRQSELDKLKDSKKKEFNQVERKAREEHGAPPTEMVQSHRNQIIEIEDLMISEKRNMSDYRDNEEREARTMFDRSEQIKITEMSKRRAMAGDNVARIRNELAGRVKGAEQDWQNNSSKWLQVARRKVTVKHREDEEATAGMKKRKGKVELAA